MIKLGNIKLGTDAEIEFAEEKKQYPVKVSDLEKFTEYMITDFYLLSCA